MIVKISTYLDTGGSALHDSVGDSGTRRVNHRHQADKSQTLQGEVALIRVERITAGVLVRGQGEVTEAEHTLAEAAKAHVRGVEGVLPFVVERALGAVDHDGAASVKDSLGGALHHEEVALVAGVLAVLVHRDLELVGRVEGDLTYLEKKTKLHLDFN